MNKLIVTLIIACCSTIFYGQAGLLDADFDGDGKLVVDVSASQDVVADIAVDTAKRIIVAGFASYNGVQNFNAIRLNPDGSPDNTFSSDGKQNTSFGTEDAYAEKVLVQTDRKIIIGGNYDGSFALLRYTASGSLDNSFSFDGKLTTAAGGAQLKALAFEGDKILAAGNRSLFDSTFTIVRYNNDGSLDQSFGTGGIKNIIVGGIDAQVCNIHPRNNGTKVITGTTVINNKRVFLATRLDANNNLDITYGTNGITIIDFATSSFAEASAINDVGRLTIVGYNTDIGGYFTVCIAQLRSSGTPEPSFGTSGRQVAGYGFYHQFGKGVALQPDGKILLGVRALKTLASNESFLAVRHNTDGSIDNTFNGNGYSEAIFNSSEDSETQTCALQNDGRLLVAGSSGTTNDYKFAIARYLTGITTGVEETQIVNNTLSVYPNPTTNKLFINYTGNAILVDIADITGKVVKRTEVDNRQQFIDVSSLTNGLYFLSINGTTTCFIKQ